MLSFVRRLVLCVIALLAATGAAGAAEMPALVPAPMSVRSAKCDAPLDLTQRVRFERGFDAGGMALVRERWSALGLPEPLLVDADGAQIRRGPGSVAAQLAYAIEPAAGRLFVRSRDAEGEFDALATIAQLPQRRLGRWVLPCLTIGDAPALRWRVVSDDISRGPFPTMRYFRERIRTLASLKINGWSPYMEQVFADPAHPYVGFPDALSAADLHDLTVYAARFHVRVIPEQQTFAHMHEALKYEQLASLAELPHGYLLNPSDPGTYAYLEPLLRAELAATEPAPFFHIGADEPLDLGRGRTPRTAQAFADHVNRLAAVVSSGGARPMIWDDAIQQDRSILQLIPKNTVIVTFHYGAEPSFAKYIATVADAGFEQMISPGANNWNEIYADLDTAYANAAQFAADGKRARVLGMFDTVWHDDGESLFEASWAPVAFAAASAWQAAPVDRATWHATFARAFFGSDDARYASDLDALLSMRNLLKQRPGDPPNYLFWSDPFDPRIGARMTAVDFKTLRSSAEDVMAHLAAARPPLHPQAAAVMRLAALKYDALGRRFQIGKEARAYYEDARAHAGGQTEGIVYRGLNVAKYLCWELRDEMTALEPLYVQAWLYESRPAALERVRVRYRLAAQQAVTYADRLNEAQREDYLRSGVLPPFETLMGIAK
ncbi:MAG: hypothetical protein NVSMB64_23070 [Candidatus Velthaea sp.]